MKRISIFLVLVLLNITLAYADGPVADTKWKDISYDGFSAKIPDSSLQTWTDEDYNYSDEIKFRVYSAHTDAGWYFAFGFNKKEAYPIDELVSFAAGRKTTVSDLVINDVPGKTLEFTEVHSLRHQALIFMVEERLFIFHAVSVPGERVEAERFLNSIRFDISKELIGPRPGPGLDDIFRVLAKPPNDRGLPDETKRSDAAVIGRASVPSPASIGGSTGGVGTGSESGKSKENANKTVDLRVLAKLRPPYTDLARHYNITGVVKLRVVFKSDGTIGDISVT